MSWFICMKKEKNPKPQPREAANTAPKMNLHTFLSCLSLLVYFFLFWNVFISFLNTFKHKEKKKRIKILGISEEKKQTKPPNQTKVKNKLPFKYSKACKILFSNPEHSVLRSEFLLWCSLQNYSKWLQ